VLRHDIRNTFLFKIVSAGGFSSSLLDLLTPQFCKRLFSSLNDVKHFISHKHSLAYDQTLAAT
jgi:hypothetical protein